MRNSQPPPDRELDLRMRWTDAVLAFVVIAYVIGVPIGLFLVCGGK